jgi:large exoprotein involved in heme utilization and adhesion
MISAASSGAGDAGSVIVTAGNFSANGAGGGLLSTARGSGNAGDVTLSANDVTLSGGAKASSDAGILGEATETGFAGLVSVHASDKLVVTGPDSAISADALGPQSGVAGTVTVSAASIMVADSGAISTKAAGVGAAGGITVSAPVLTIDNGSINSNTSGSGAGGSITLDVDARLTMLDTATALPPSEILAQSSESGKAGSITVQGLVGNLPPAVSLAGGSKISAASTGAGDAGSVIVTAGNFSANGSGSGLLSTATVAGNAGQVTLEADTVTLSNGAVVSSNVLKGYPTGPKGNVMVTAIGSIKLDSGASISAGASGAEAAGDITIQTATLIVDQGNISTSASGSGAGGAILVQGFGLGALPLVSLSDGSQISAASSGQSNAGSIVLSANSLAMTTGASISTSAATANGGNISISTQYLTYLQQSKISTTVDGAKGNGGNIGIESGRYVILDSANVEADAAGGNGGNITIATKQFIASPDSIVQASSATGISGDITIRAPADTVTAALANLSTRLGAPNVRLDCSAAAERTGTSSVIPRGQHVSSEGGSEMESMRYFAGRPIIAALPGSPSAGTGAPPAIGIPVPAANEADWPAQTACH